MFEFLANLTDFIKRFFPDKVTKLRQAMGSYLPGALQREAVREQEEEKQS